jgi:hypothetical protein
MVANMAFILAAFALLLAASIAVLRCPLIRTVTLAIDSWADEIQGELKQ